MAPLIGIAIYNATEVNLQQKRLAPSTEMYFWTLQKG